MQRDLSIPTKGKLASEYTKILRNAKTNMQRYHDEPMKLKEELNSLTKNIVTVIIQKKLVPISEIEKFFNTTTHLMNTTQKISIDILCEIFPILGLLNKLQKYLMENYVVNFDNPSNAIEKVI